MSKFFKALEQAERDRALAGRTQREGPPSVPTERDGPAPVPTTIPPAAPAPPISRRPAPVPRRVVEQPEGVDDHLVSLVAPSGWEAEQYRALRYLVEQKHRTASLSVLAVSSPNVGDGKTTTAVNLAGALAQAPEVRVLLVEADLRRPSIANLLGFDEGSGPGLVSAILDPRIGLPDIVQQRPPFNLHVTVAGQTPPSPYEFLKSPRLGELLDQARAQYDYVILDTPPLAPVQDCRVIARWVDGLLLVVAAHRTPRQVLEIALEAVDPAKVIGIVFNGYDELRSGHYRTYYHAYTPSAADTGDSSRWSRASKKVAVLLRGQAAPSSTPPSKNRPVRGK